MKRSRYVRSKAIAVMVIAGALAPLGCDSETMPPPPVVATPPPLTNPATPPPPDKNPAGQQVKNIKNMGRPH